MDMREYYSRNQQAKQAAEQGKINFNPSKDDALNSWIQRTGVERAAQMYGEWAKQMDDANEKAKAITRDYKSKNALADSVKQIKQLAIDGDFFNQVGQRLGFDDVAENINAIKTNATSIDDLVSFYSQWETEGDYTKAMNEKTDREKFDEQYAGKGYAEKYSSYEYAAALESELEKQKGIRSLVFSNNNVDESELSAEDKARYIDNALNKKISDNAYTTPGYENQTYKGYDGLISQEEFEYMQGLYDVLISERKDRYALRRQEAQLREQQEANAEIVKNIYLSGASVANLVADYKDLETDEESVGALKKEIRQRLKAKGYSSAQISDILEYAEGERNQEKISKIMDELGEELEDANGFQKLGILFENNLLGSHIVGAVTSIVDNVGEIFTTEMFTGEYGSGYNHAYAGGNYLNQFISAKNQTVSESIENPAMRSVVDFTTSTIQSASTLLVSVASAAAIYYVSGGTASGLVLKDLVSGVGATMFGITSAGSTMTDVVSRGGTPQQALSLGVLSGAIETATEKLQLDKLVDIFTKTDVTKGFLRNVFSSGLKQMPAEAGEEFISQMAGYITDLGVMGWDESQIGEMWRNNVSSGLSESDAAAQTFLDILGGATYAGLGGAFSGFVMGGSTSTLAQTINYFGNRNTGKKIVKNNMVEPLLKYASSVTVSDVNMQKQLASILEQQKQSNADIGKVFSIVSNNATQNLQAEVNALNGVSQNTDLTKAVTKSLLGAPLSSSEQSLVNSDSGITLLYKASRSQAYTDAQTVFGFLKESEQQNTETQDGDVSSTPTSATGDTSDSGDASVSGLPASDVASPDDTPVANVPTSKVDENGKIKTIVIDGVEVDVETWQPVINEPNLTDTSGANTYLAKDADEQPFMHTDEHIRVENIAEKLGMKLQWASNMGAEGLYSKGVVYLNPHCEHPKLMLFKHEFTHYLENSPWYNSFVKYLKSTQVYQDWIEDNHFGEAAYTEELTKKYAAAGLELDVTHEIVANFVAERVLGGKGGFVRDAYGRYVSSDPVIVKALTEFAENHAHWYDAILTHIKDIAAKLKGLYYKVTGKDAKPQSESQELDEIYRRLVQLKDTVNTKKAAQNEAGQFMSGESKIVSNNKKSSSDNSITLDDVRTVQGIGRMSINQFGSEEIKKAEKWARKFYKELGIKSPFFRAWFGDWRAFDISPANIIKFAYGETPKVNYKKREVHSDELNCNILIDKTVIEDSISYAKKNGDEKQITKILGKIDEILSNGILLDTQTSIKSSGNKKGSTQFIHYLYTPISINNAPFIAKLTIEEYGDGNKYRSYNLQRIKISEVSRAQYSQLIDENRGKYAYTSDALSVAQLFEFVKQYDTNFNPKPVSKHMLNNDGTPKVFYHGTNADFTTFDKKKSKPGFYGKGFYFTTEKNQANVYGKEMAEYLAIKNPLVPGESTVTTEQIYKFLEAVAENEDYSVENYGTYDINEILSKIESRDVFAVIQDVNTTAIGDFGEAMQLFNEVNGTEFDGVITPTETVVYNPTQIKSANDNIGTFDGANPDTQYYVSTSRHSDLHEQYKAGKITLEDYQAEVDARDKAQAAEIRKLRQQKKNLQDARAQLQERFKNEHGGWNENKALEVLRGILKEYPTKVAATKLRPAYFELLTYIQNHPNATMDELEGKAIDLIANPILDSMKTLKNEEAQEMLADIKKMRFRLSDEQLAEIKYIYGRVQHWRHSVQGKVRITDDADAMTLDQAWKEMSELYPDKFDPEANSLDMPALLDDIITQASEEISVFEIMPRESMAREIALRAIGGYHQVPKVILHADQVQREINREREKNIKQSQRQKRSQLRQQIRSLYTDFKKRLFNGNDNVYVPEEFRQVVCDVLECLTYIVSDGNKESVTAKLEALSGKLANVKSEGSKFGREFMTEEFLEDAKHFSGYANAIANTIAGKDASELTLTEMQDIVNLCGDIKYALQHATAILRDGKAESVAEAADSLVMQQRNVSEKESINWIDRENLNPLRIVQRMGEYDEDSVIIKLFRDIEKGYIKQMRYQADCNKRFEDVIATDPQAYEKMCNEVIEWKPVNSELKRVRMTKMQAMQILMTYDRERNGVTRHLEEGGVRIVDAELVLKGKYQEAKAKAQKLIVTEGVYNSIREQLFSSNDATFIKEYWDTAYELFNHYSRDAINEVSMQRQHRMIATTKNYIPMIVDGDYIEANLEGVSFNYSLANTGSLKSVERGAVAPVMVEGLNFVVRRNIDTTAKIYGMLIPVENCKKVINQSTDTGVRVHGIIKERWGEKTYNVVSQVLEDVQKKRTVDKPTKNSDYSELLKIAERHFVTAVLAGRVTTVVSQFSAYFSAGAHIEQKHLLKTLKDLPKNSINYEKIEAEIDAHTPLHMERRDELTAPELRDIISQDSFVKKAFDKLNDKKGLWALNLYNQITRADRQITRLLWLACKDQVNAKTPKSEIGTDAYWSEVANLYERVIFDTQSTYSPLHRAEVSKTLDVKKKYAFGFFKTEPLQHYGTMHDAYHKMKVAKRKGNAEMLKSARKQFARTIVSQVEIALSYTLLKFVAGVLTAKLSKRWRDDDKELTAESISKELGRTGGEALLSSFLPMTSDIVFSIGEALYGIISGEGVEYYASEVLEIPSFSQFNDLLDSFYASLESAGDMFDEESDKTPEEKSKKLLQNLRDMAEIIGNFTGIPIENIGTIFNGIYKHGTAIIKGEDLSYALDMGVERSNAIESHRMYEALLDGDTEKYNEIYDSLIAKGLTKAQIKNGVARIIADTNSKVSEAAEISRERDKLADDEQSKDKYNDLTTQLNTYILNISGEGKEEIPVDFVTKAIELKVSDLEGERLSSADKTKIETTAADLSDKYNDELQQSDYYKGATPLEQSAISSKVEKYANAVAKAEVDDEYELSNDYTAIHILETEDDVSVVELLVLYETADVDADGKVTVQEYARAINQSKQLSNKQKQFLISLKKAKNDEVRQKIWDNYRNN